MAMSPITWTSAQISRLKKAVKNFNAKVDRLARKYAGTDVQIPEKTTFTAEKAQIHNRNQLYRREAQLNRLSIWDKIKTAAGNKILEWQKREIVRKVARENKGRRALLEKVAPAFEQMSPVEQVNLMSDNYLSPVPKDVFYGKGGNKRLKEFFGLGDSYRDNWRTYIERYIMELEKYADYDPRYAEIADIIRYAIEHGSLDDVIETFAGHHVETEIVEIYPQSPDMRSFDIRSNQLYNFWDSFAAQNDIDFDVIYGVM